MKIGIKVDSSYQIIKRRKKKADIKDNAENEFRHFDTHGCPCQLGEGECMRTLVKIITCRKFVKLRCSINYRNPFVTQYITYLNIFNIIGKPGKVK